MVRWIPDRTGRFKERPHYDQNELDTECETLIVRFLQKSYGRVDYPISTDDLTKLIETKADLDQYADLSDEGTDVEGVTRFGVGRQPTVEISQALSEDERRENRLRTTLTHEFGHVHFHDALIQMKFATLDLFAARADEKVVCKRDKIVDAPFVDWLEWQACYASGSLLMPKSALAELVQGYRRERGLQSSIMAASGEGALLIDRVKERFRTSSEAARVRLLKLRFIEANSGASTLFD
jgi:hypothetical protein